MKIFQKNANKLAQGHAQTYVNTILILEENLFDTICLISQSLKKNNQTKDLKHVLGPAP